jgi:hypothetical protein
MKSGQNSRYASIPKRTFRNSIVHLLEEEYKMVGSHKVVNMIADDIVALHQEFYPELERKTFGHIAWRTTAVMNHKPSYGTKVEDYEVKTVFLPLVTEGDVEQRIETWYRPQKQKDDGAVNYKKQMDRDVEVMARLIKSAYEQGGLLSGAELSVLLNRSLTNIGKYMRIYHQTHQDILPTKGMILDQGSKPSHKGSIINLYEQGYPEVDIARLTTHTIESVGRYIRRYKNVKLLLEKNCTLMELVRLTGMGRSTAIQYRDLVYLYHDHLRPKESETSLPAPEESDQPENRRSKSVNKKSDAATVVERDDIFY